MPQPTTLTAAIAVAHERLYPRVTALLKQVERSASRHPEHPVPAATRNIANALFAEARKILGREAGRIAGTATADLSALALGLGQVVAMLEAFEAANSSFSYDLRAVAWDVRNAKMPVSRLKPAGLVKGFAPVNPQKQADGDKLRTKIARRIDEIASARYMSGYRDGKAGRPPQPPFHGNANMYSPEDRPTYPRD